MLRQRDRFDAYREGAGRARPAGPALSGVHEPRRDRRGSRARRGADWPRDPDGAPLYPGAERDWSDVAAPGGDGERKAIRAAARHGASACGRPAAVVERGRSLRRRAAALRIPPIPPRWGDVILARKEVPASYHIAVVVDDAFQGVTDVVRGKDLEAATSVHRLLQTLLGLPEPRYFHHRLILDERRQEAFEVARLGDDPRPPRGGRNSGELIAGSASDEPERPLQQRQPKRSTRQRTPRRRWR